MTITVTRGGKRPGGVEIVFSEKPSKEVCQELSNAWFNFTFKGGPKWYGPEALLPEQYKQYLSSAPIVTKSPADVADELVEAEEVKEPEPPPQPKVRSYKVACKTRSCDTWSYNAMRYPTKELAEAAGSDLYSSWTALEKWEVHESEDEPNYKPKTEDKPEAKPAPVEDDDAAVEARLKANRKNPKWADHRAAFIAAEDKNVWAENCEARRDACNNTAWCDGDEWDEVLFTDLLEHHDEPYDVLDMVAEYLGKFSELGKKVKAKADAKLKDVKDRWNAVAKSAASVVTPPQPQAASPKPSLYQWKGNAAERKAAWITDGSVLFNRKHIGESAKELSKRGAFAKCNPAPVDKLVNTLQHATIVLVQQMDYGEHAVALSASGKPVAAAPRNAMEFAARAINHLPGDTIVATPTAIIIKRDNEIAAVVTRLKKADEDNLFQVYGDKQAKPELKIVPKPAPVAPPKPQVSSPKSNITPISSAKPLSLEERLARCRAALCGAK